MNTNTRLGYCCLNKTINLNRSNKDQIRPNRSVTKKTLQEKGLLHLSQLIEQNILDTISIIEWNIENDIYVYRMSSDMFPWITEYDFKDLPNYSTIQSLLQRIGNLAKTNDMRLSFHPGPFNVLGSQNQDVVDLTIHELNQHALLMDLMGLDKSDYYPINIHLGTYKPSHADVANKFCDNFRLLSDSAKARLTIENDDSSNLYSVKMLYDLVYTKIKIPIVFDQHHFNYGPQDQTILEAITLAASTWKTKPLIHMSSSAILENCDKKQIAHADYIYDKIIDTTFDFDVEIEAKQKELALIKYKKDFL